MYNNLHLIGQVTDAKIMKTSDGKSRYFGFIGYRTEREANEALKYFNNTYIHTSRIVVEHAKPVNDSSLSRPWSAHSVGSSKYEMNHQQFRQQNPNNISLDGNSKNAKTQESDEDELYQDLPKKGKKVVVKSTNSNNYMSETSSSESEDEEMQDVDTTINSISDTDWLKSRMKGKLDLEDEGESLDDSSSDNESSQSDEENDNIDVQSYHTDSEEVQTQDILPNKEANNSNQSDEVPAEESIGETGRLFVRNLPYICTEEDLRKEFVKFGPLAEVHMPLDKETKKQKGFAYILYHIPEHAVMAYMELDNKFFMGRLLHILPSWEKPISRDVDQSRWSLKKQKEMKLKAQATSDFNWGTLYMNSNSIAESIANRFKIKKSDILDPESDNMSARLALAETHIIQETKAFLSENGMCLDSFGKKEKSDTVILVKNIPYSTTNEDLQQLFGWYGEIGRILIPPAQTLAVIEFLHPTEARNAFTNLAYKKFKGVPLYLEKAPSGIFKNDESSEQEGKKIISSADLVEPTPDIDDDNVDVDSEVTATLFVKNISFETTEEGLKNVFKSTPGMKSAKIKMKNDQKNPGKKLSMGFGFVEYDSIKNAKNALKAMQNYLLDGHALQLKFSNRGEVIQRKKKDEITKKKQESTKVIVKNVAFETTIKELRELFGAYGQIKSLRIPKKFDRSSRGFAFIEFLTKRDARNVMENLRDTHLLGRHLILEYAETEKNVEELREKAGREFIADIEGGDGRMRKRKKVDMDDWKESQQNNDDEMEE
ncbi:17355_t:CDS:10 [Funneliformis geosporum]|uniref:17355_t:CDS:1 n=1 Tax=Funneliformis geosporum TaxID=1117311 RepID=A0A9W4SHH7_9GLOM|nr:17355_t:CDS:10 [Funneliformis geosporum]